MIIDKNYDSFLRSDQFPLGGKPHSSERNSGIELLKIFAIFLIILAHVIQTLGSKNALVEYQDYVLDLSTATTNLQQFILVLLRCTGMLGNAVFFICSAWFLLDGKTIDKKKWWFMLLEVWSVSIVILVITYILRAGNITSELIIKSLFPNTLSVSWYMTCYLLFYPIHPFLNAVIRRISQTDLLKIASLLFLINIGMNFVKPDLLYSTKLTIWIAIYFMVAYIKFYAKDFVSNTTVNLVLLFIALVGHVGIILITNLLGLRIGFFADKLFHWNTNSNPFLIVAAICLFNLARKIDWKNYIVDHISKQSMLIYLIHENIILKNYYRPYLINYIYERFGYHYVALWAFALMFAVFFASICASFLYEYTLQRLVKPTSEKLCELFSMLYQKYENLILKFH